jgi:hypothetical protein
MRVSGIQAPFYPRTCRAWSTGTELAFHAYSRNATHEEVAVGKNFGGGALIAVALFMLVGYLRSGVDPWAPATVLALRRG